MKTHNHLNSFGAKTRLGGAYYYRLAKLAEENIVDVSGLPFSIKILLESVLRSEDGYQVTRDDVVNLAGYNPSAPDPVDIPFKPARILLQDFTGVPAMVDLAALRSAMERLGGDPQRINPSIPVDLVIDHSVQVDVFNRPDAALQNTAIEFERNRERYEFLHWGQRAFRNFRVIPPGSGICHQVNLEYLATVVQQCDENGEVLLFPDTLVGTDSHTTMINGLGVLGWGVGGIEAEAGMLGQPLYMLSPEVVGFKLTGRLPAGATATDLVLTVTEILRRKGVVGKFVEYFGDGVRTMSVSDRATLANMSPEYGATVGFFPVDNRTLEYLLSTGRSKELIDIVERYCKEQGLFRTDNTPDPIFSDVVELDLSQVEPSVAGPKRPQDRSSLGNLKPSWANALRAPQSKHGFELSESKLDARAEVRTNGTLHTLKHGDVVIAAITSCTNTSNPSVMLGAGLLAKKAVEAGLSVAPHIKTSLAPGSKVVTEYLQKTGLSHYLEKLGFYTVGYGCTTCIGNSGPLPEAVAEAIDSAGIIAASVLSGNRNFTGRIHPQTKASYLASPPLVVAFAIAGTVDIDLTVTPIGKTPDGRDVYLKDIWPSPEEIVEYLPLATDRDTYIQKYDGIEHSNPEWNCIKATPSAVYDWDEDSTYIQEPPFFKNMSLELEPIRPIREARALVKAGDSVTTDHISPAGSIPENSDAGRYLIERGTRIRDFNSFGSRRGNDRVMTRGTFANITFRNLLAGGKTGGWSRHFPSGEVMTVYQTAKRYAAENVPVIVLAGSDYGMGSSRDWAAKGTFLLGVRAVIAVSFERIHRSNLVGMGVLPLQFKNSDDLGRLTGEETFTIPIGESDLRPGSELSVECRRSDGSRADFPVVCRLDSPVEIDYYRNGGILETVLRGMLNIITQ